MKAWELLEQTGWCQGAMTDQDGCICAFHAVIQIYGYGSPEESRLSWLIEGSISTWNDAPGRTKAEVIAALKAADV